MNDLVKRLRSEAVYLPEKFSKNAELLDVLMKAADAIEELQKVVEKEQAFAKCWEEMATDCKDRFQKLLDAYPKWIPVEERLPYKIGYYLIVTHLGLPDDAEDWKKDNAVDVTMAHYADYSNIWTTDSGAAYNADLSKCDKTRYEYVTHWMPLPEPPEPVGNSEQLPSVPFDEVWDKLKEENPDFYQAAEDMAKQINAEEGEI